MHQPVHPHNPDPASERDQTTPAASEDTAPTTPVGPFSGPAENGYRPAPRVNVPNPYTRPLKVDDVDTGAHPVGQWRGVGLNEPEPRVVRAPEPARATGGDGAAGEGDAADGTAPATDDRRAKAPAPEPTKADAPVSEAPVARESAPAQGSAPAADREPTPAKGEAPVKGASRRPVSGPDQPAPSASAPKAAPATPAPVKADIPVSEAPEPAPAKAATPAPVARESVTAKADAPVSEAPVARESAPGNASAPAADREPTPAKGEAPVKGASRRPVSGPDQPAPSASAPKAAPATPAPAKAAAPAPVARESVPVEGSTPAVRPAVDREPAPAKDEAPVEGAPSGSASTPGQPAPSASAVEPAPAEGAAPAHREPSVTTDRAPANTSVPTAPAPAGRADAEPASRPPVAASGTPAPTVPPLRPIRARTRPERAGAAAETATRSGDTPPPAPDHTSTDDRSGRHGTRPSRVPAGQDGARPPEGAPPMADHTHTPSEEPGEQHERHRPHAADAPTGHQAADHTTAWGHRPTGPAGPPAPGRPQHTYDEQGWRGSYGPQPAPPSPGRQGYQVPQEPTGLPQPPAGYGYGPQQYPPAPDPRGPWQDGQQQHGYPPPYPYGAYQQAAPHPQPMQYAVPYPPHPLVTYQSAYPAPFQPPGYVLPGQPVVYPAPYQAQGQPVQHVIVLTPGQPPQVLTAEPVPERAEHPERVDRPQEQPRERLDQAEQPKALPRPEAAAQAPSAPAPETPRVESAPAAQSAPAPVPAPAPAPEASAAPTAPVADQTEAILNEALAGLAMRDLSLVDALLEMVEELETDAKDPDLLDKLFQIDNFATRMRRNGENFLVLTGHDGGESDAHDEIVPLLDVARAATSEIKDYPRVRLGKLPQTSITGMAADDISHLLAELLDNATANSPEHSQVVVSAREMDDGRLMMIVEDEGVGIPEHQLGELNDRLSGSPRIDDDVSRHMGLYVASRIGRKHGLETRLESRAFRGVNAYTIIPKELLRVATPPTPGKPRTSAIPSTPGPSVGSGSQALTPPPVTGTNGVNGSSAPKRTNGGDPSVTAAGLPRRSATPHGSPLRMMPHPKSSPPPAPPSDTPRLTGDARAEQIRDDLGDFLDGEREAREESDGKEGGTT
ncbi:histidine kinase/DNA gyrase B/HSP90-like ATPase [Nocardiopsis sp. Huas11]|uniref:ATP-binding protein n=1 Tax=Nocardiopsis sp. Huas11 TaxID=2183912 RepID=UPI000F103C53|nr:ATP-binding protein [Nocardiopsis sp. Huas11]RKS10389.1 histidine kinase/DNA gyrase B/HSP90-like ATPase [Nocardiopsis sp. Huas11]